MIRFLQIFTGRKSRRFRSAACGVAFAIFVSAGAGPAQACLTPGSLIGRADPQGYVFLGSVLGYTRPQKTTESRKVIGIKVSVSSFVSPAKDVSPEFVVYPMRRMADCTRGGYDANEIRSAFPMGAQVRVIGRKSDELGLGAEYETVLEAGFVNHTSISINPRDATPGRNSVSEEFDYTLATSSFLGSSAERFYFVAFEVQKDLWRLERASSRTQRNRILDRLRFAPDYAQLSFDLIEASYDVDKPSDKH